MKKDIQSDLSKELFTALKGTLIPVQRVPVERINRITRKNHQGVVAFISSVTYQKTDGQWDTTLPVAVAFTKE